MRKNANYVVLTLILMLGLSSVHASFPSTAMHASLAALEAGVKLFDFIHNIVHAFILMVCNIDNNDESVKAAYYSLMANRPNGNVTSCLIGCLASAAYNTKQVFINVTRIDPFSLVRHIVGEHNYQQVQYCAKKVQDDKCAMSFLFIHCVVNQFYSEFNKDLHNFQDGVRETINGFPRLMQEYIAKDGIPGGYFDIAMGLPTLIPRLLNLTAPILHETETTTIPRKTENHFSTNQPIHILTKSPAISTPLAYSRNTEHFSSITPD